MLCVWLALAISYYGYKCWYTWLWWACNSVCYVSNYLSKSDVEGCRCSTELQMLCWCSSRRRALLLKTLPAFKQKVDSQTVMAAWTEDDGHVLATCPLLSDVRPGRISYFMKHYVRLNGKITQYVHASVQWFVPSVCTRYRKPAGVWEYTRFVSAAPSSFMSVQRLAGKFAWATFSDNTSRLQVVCPMF